MFRNRTVNAFFQKIVNISPYNLMLPEHFELAQDRLINLSNITTNDNHFAEKATSLSLQQTLKEALRVAAAQRQLQRSKAKANNSNDVRSVISNSNNNNCSSAHNGTIGNIATSTNVQATATFPLLAPFLLPGNLYSLIYPTVLFY